MTIWLNIGLILACAVIVILLAGIKHLADENAELREQVRKLTRRNYL